MVVLVVDLRIHPAAIYIYIYIYIFFFFMENDTNLFSIHILFKFTIRFMGFTLDLINLMIDLKLSCMKMNRGFKSNISLF
jgi:hypothetical protein